MRNETGVAVVPQDRVARREAEAPAESGTHPRLSAGVPSGKRVLNTHISLEEHTFLKSMASKNSMTVTMFLRNLIRREMQRANRAELDPRASY